MPRPIRIKYEDAFYHVMNRGRGHQDIFHNSDYFEKFLESLAEAHQKFGVVIHAYCLMTSHYHLLVQTPLANLDRIMRHINGTYTQRYNRLAETDGTLFRGRYKAILVDVDCYLLQLSRYIHRNPIETTEPMVERLEDYQWSSYPAYVGKSKCPEWLERDLTYQTLGQKQRYRGMRDYVLLGNEQELLKFYERGNSPNMIGDGDFRRWFYEEKAPTLELDIEKIIQTTEKVMIDDIVKAVSDHYSESIEHITETTRQPAKENVARKMAMLISQDFAGYSLKEIQENFNLTNANTVSGITSKMRKACANQKEWMNAYTKIIGGIIKNAT